ncbi:MAG TPA: hypothetical protein VK570_07365 [Rubrivivax sp.]|nr:hypothetical protein [Rubrivivax sp.]
MSNLSNENETESLTDLVYASFVAGAKFGMIAGVLTLLVSALSG